MTESVYMCVRERRRVSSSHPLGSGYFRVTVRTRDGSRETQFESYRPSPYTTDFAFPHPTLPSCPTHRLNSCPSPPGFTDLTSGSR